MRRMIPFARHAPTLLGAAFLTSLAGLASAADEAVLEIAEFGLQGTAISVQSTGFAQLAPTSPPQLPLRLDFSFDSGPLSTHVASALQFDQPLRN